MAKKSHIRFVNTEFIIRRRIHANPGLARLGSRAVGVEQFCLAIHVEVRNIRLKDSPPKLVVLSEPALEYLKQQWEARSNMTPQEWVKYGIDNGLLEVKT